MNTPQTPDHTSHGEGGLKIIGAGFGRTGTLSLKVALEDLGFGPCYHMTEVFQHPEHAKEWLAAARDQPQDWNKLFAGYQATVDWPGCSFYLRRTDGGLSRRQSDLDGARPRKVA